MGKKKSKKNIPHNARQKTNREEIPLIVDQVGNGGGMPTSTPGLATVLNGVGDERKVVADKPVEAMTLEKEIQFSTEQLDRNAIQPPAREDETLATHAISNSSPAREETSISKDKPVLRQEKEEAQSLQTKSSTSLKNTNGLFSKQPSNRSQERQERSSSRREISLSLQAEEVLPSSHRNDSSILTKEQKKRKASGRKDPSLPLQEQEERSIGKKLEAPIPKRKEITVAKRKEPSVSQGKKTSIPYPRQENLEIPKERTVTLSKQEKRSVSMETEVSLAFPGKRNEQAGREVSKEPIVTLSKHKEAVLSKTSRNSVMNRKDAILSKNSKVKELRQIFEDNNQPSPDLTNAELNLETHDKCERKGKILSKTSCNLPKTSCNLPSKQEHSTLSKNHRLKEFPQLFEGNAHASEWADASLNFETSINEASLGSLLDIPAHHVVQNTIHSLKRGIDGENETKNKNIAKKSTSHVNIINRARQESEETRKKLTEVSTAIKTSNNPEKTDKRSKVGPASVSVSRVIRSDRERKRREHVKRENAFKPPVDNRTLNETPAKQIIPSRRAKDETSSSNRRHQKQLLSVRNREELYEDKAAIASTSQPEPLNSSQKETGIRYESLKMLRTDKGYEKHERLIGTSKHHEKQMGRNVFKTQSHALESIELRKSSRCKGQDGPREIAISKEWSRSNTQNRTSKKPQPEKEHRKSSSTRNRRDRKRETVSAEPVSNLAENTKSRRKFRGMPDVRQSLLPFSFSKMLGRDVDENAIRKLEHGISDTIFQVMETVENKIARECFVEQKAVRSKSCYPFRK